jgi:hypothetical protein
MSSIVIDRFRLGGFFLDCGVGFLTVEAADFSDAAAGGTLIISGVDRAVGAGLDVKLEETVWFVSVWFVSVWLVFV